MSNPQMTNAVRRVMVGTDRSESAEQAVQWAASFAERYAAELFVVRTTLQWPVIIAIAVTRVPLATRVIRSVVIAAKEQPYVEAARALGGGPWRTMICHLAPQCVAPLLIIASFNLGTAIFAEAALSFLGVGVPPPTPSWGSMLGGVLAEAFKPPWWLIVFPGLAITVTIVAANLLGDALRDFLDPKMKRHVE